MVAQKVWPAVVPAISWVKALAASGIGVVQVDGVPYLVEAQKAGGAVSGYRLTNCVNGKVYDVDCQSQGGLACDCPDATFRRRPGGCKHCHAIATVKA